MTDSRNTLSEGNEVRHAISGQKVIQTENEVSMQSGPDKCGQGTERSTQEVGPGQNIFQI
jgi:hypothetical protein